MSLNYQDRIPNNVELGSNRILQRALEHWQPEFMRWWQDLGPTDFQASDVYLRTAISVDTKGWATFGYVRMPEYRWGIFLADPENDRRIGFGDNLGEPAWQQVPGEHRANLRRLIVTQGDTEPASVEQQRLLGHTAPSLYDLRNLFQVNVEEGRHLWAMVYLFHAYFGRDGREEAEELLERHCGDADKPRILGTFNEPIRDWLSFLHVHLFHRPRRKIPIEVPRRIRLRSAFAHLPLHAHRGSASYVRRRHGNFAGDQALPGSDEGAQQR